MNTHEKISSTVFLLFDRKIIKMIDYVYECHRYKSTHTHFLTLFRLSASFPKKWINLQLNFSNRHFSHTFRLVVFPKNFKTSHSSRKFWLVVLGPKFLETKSTWMQNTTVLTGVPPKNPVPTGNIFGCPTPDRHPALSGGLSGRK